MVYEKNYGVVAYKKIYPQRIDGMTLNSSKVLYSAKNSAGEITDLIINDVTGDARMYGIIMDKDSNIIDLLNIKPDLDAKIIKTVGNPRYRLKEDSLIIEQNLTKLLSDIEEKITETEVQEILNGALQEDGIIVQKIDEKISGLSGGG